MVVGNLLWRLQCDVGRLVLLYFLEYGMIVEEKVVGAVEPVEVVVEEVACVGDEEESVCAFLLVGEGGDAGYFLWLQEGKKGIDDE